MSTSGFSEFFRFFNSVIVGKLDSSDDEINTFMKSDSLMDAVSAEVTEGLMNISTQIDQSALIAKEIIVKCNTPRLLDYHLEPLGKRKTWYGADIKQDECVRFGCCYDVNQSSDVTFRALNNISTEQHQELWNKIKQRIEHQVHMTVTDNDNGVKSLSETLNRNEVKNVAVTQIRKHITNEINTNIENKQTIIIEHESPLRCIHGCSGPQTAGNINQNANIQILIYNIKFYL